MNPYRVKSQQEVEDDLKARGFSKTEHRIATGTIWKSSQTGKHLVVPDPYEGMYPEFILKDLHDRMACLGQRSVH